MTKNSDFKKLVRARMEKTGESYAAARAQLTTNAPDPEEYADVAGISEDSVRQGTGRGWLEWVQVLDGHSAHALDHAAIARWVAAEHPAVNAWWAQSITVTYERIKGIRVKGQTHKGDFQASKSRTFPVPVAVLFAAFDDPVVRERWVGVSTVVRTAKADRTIRLGLPDGTIAAAWFTDKGEKSAVSVQHGKLESAARREAEKARWAERFDVLGAILSG